MIDSRVSAHERIWTFYLATVVGVDVAFGLAATGGRPWLHASTHILLLAVVWWLPCWIRGPVRLAIARGLLTTFGLVFVFSSLAWILPAIHPEPYEFRWLAFDRWVWGVDPTVWGQRWLHPAFVEVLQVCYAVFYFVPMAAVGMIGWARGLRAYQRALETVLFGFTLSYLGYLWWPTLPPYRYLDHAVPLRGVWLAESIHTWLDSAEIHRWNCFPSGHTMLSVLSLAITWNGHRRTFWGLFPGVVLLVSSTVLLRYHFVVDVVAGLLGVVLTLGLARLVIPRTDASLPHREFTLGDSATRLRS